MKFLTLLLAFSTLTAWAAGPTLDDLSKDDLEKVADEISVNFSHTAVAAPETTGLWGIELGLIGGVAGTPKLKDLVEDAGEDGSDFKSIPHAGLMARAHFPFELFAELSFIPSFDVADLEIQNKTFAAGWNAGGFFSWPLDVAIGFNYANSELSFDQVINNASTSNNDVDANVSFETKSHSLWVGVSKTILVFTPYAKVGTFSSSSDVEVDTSGGNGTIFAFSNGQKEDVSSSGMFGAIGVNAQLLLMRFGLEASRAAGVGRVTGKFSLAF